MPEPILSVEAIKAQAQAAAHKFDCVNDACPYSFYTQAGRVFKAEFQKARMAINVPLLQHPAPGGVAP